MCFWLVNAHPFQNQRHCCGLRLTPLPSFEAIDTCLAPSAFTAAGNHLNPSTKSKAVCPPATEQEQGIGDMIQLKAVLKDDHKTVDAPAQVGVNRRFRHA